MTTTKTISDNRINRDNNAKTTMKTMDTKKFYVIASTEYKANMPDMFVMDEEGNYYGVAGASYAKFHNYPSSVDYWRRTCCSDAGRYFNIDEVELPVDMVEEFDRLTKEYYRLDAEQPVWKEKCPSSMWGGYKTKKAYREAFDDYCKRYGEWSRANNAAYYIVTKNNLWRQRTDLFCSFSEKVFNEIKDNEGIKYHK